jgi:hypothetical protein
LTITNPRGLVSIDVHRGRGGVRKNAIRHKKAHPPRFSVIPKYTLQKILAKIPRTLPTWISNYCASMLVSDTNISLGIPR